MSKLICVFVFAYAKRQFSHAGAHISMMCNHMSRLMGKQTFHICENKDAVQLRGNRKADQRLCLRYLDSTIPLSPKYKILILQLSPVAVQPALCQTWSESKLLVFSRSGSCLNVLHTLNFRGASSQLY